MTVMPPGQAAVPGAPIAWPPTSVASPSSASPGGSVGQGGNSQVPPVLPGSAAMIKPVSVETITTTTIEKGYGGTMLAVDLSALSLTVLAPFTAGVTLIGGVGVYALGGPIVHWSHGEVGRGFASLGLRVGVPIASGYALYGLTCPKRSGHELSEYGQGLGCVVTTGFGVLLGMTGAAIADHLLLVKDRASSSTTQRVSWSPTLAPSREGMTLGVVGAW